MEGVVEVVREVVVVMMDSVVDVVISSVVVSSLGIVDGCVELEEMEVVVISVRSWISSESTTGSSSWKTTG